MLAIFIYHIIVRFPRLNAFVECLLKDPTSLVNLCQTKKNLRQTKKNSQFYTSVTFKHENQDEQTNEPQVVRFSVLREPLLESGVVELIEIGLDSN